jgi:hypothetical protein
MSGFNISSYLKNQYLAEAGEASSKATSLVPLILNAISKVDDDLSYKDLAETISIILTDHYGSHNFGPFMDVLHSKLGINESLTEEEDDGQLGRDFEDKFNVDAHSRITGDNGELTIQVKEDIDDNKFEDMVKFIEGYGFKVDKKQSNSYYDVDPGERMWYPTIKFSK